MKFTIGVKKEMTQIFGEDGQIYPVTLIDVKNTKVVGVRKSEKDGYNAIILGSNTKKRFIKAEKVKYSAVGNVPVKVTEFRVEKIETDPTIGQFVDFEAKEGDKLNITGMTKGKGFAGVVKRYGFKGGPKTHGQSDRQRAPGAIASGTTPGRVFKGKRMAGHMGMDRQTTKNLKLVKFDKESGLLYVKGAVPGAKMGYVLVNISKSISK